MARLHDFKELPETDERQVPDLSRMECSVCGILRANRFGGGLVYSADGRFWDRRRPDCRAKKDA